MYANSVRDNWLRIRLVTQGSKPEVQFYLMVEVVVIFYIVDL